ncbi:MAG TPA: MarR family transcriptional regulator [Thermoanaerobaculia bacterium]|jgi:DNA-binding MarR family transcriptional regulator|nr:MarR family transcriptional regulator [Thermoanaerobaculia bacterium]
MAARSIAEDIKQTRPFRSRSQEASMALLRTANVLRRRLDALVASEGITSQQYNVLRILRGAKAPLPTMEIAERMIEQTPGITRHVNNLEERGLIRREPWAGDRRQVLCQITPNGLRLLERLDEPMDALDDALAAQLTSEQIDHLIEALDLLRSTPES